MAVRYQKASLGELRTAAFHTGMSDVHGLVSLEHADKAINAGMTSRSGEFHSSVANAHDAMGSREFRLAKSGVSSSAATRSMRMSRNPAYSPRVGKQIDN